MHVRFEHRIDDDQVAQPAMETMFHRTPCDVA